MRAPRPQGRAAAVLTPAARLKPAMRRTLCRALSPLTCRSHRGSAAEAVRCLCGHCTQKATRIESLMCCTATAQYWMVPCAVYRANTVQCGTGPPLPWRSAERCCAVSRQRCCSHRICTLSGYSGRYIDRSAKSTVTIKVHLNLKWPSRRPIMIVHDEASRTRRHALCTRGDDDRA